MAVLETPIGQPAPAPAPPTELDDATYGGRECIFCHDKGVVADDIELLERCGPQKWCVCVRCFHHVVEDEKPISKKVAAQVAVEEKDLTLRTIKDHERGGILE
jgi:hypothetical protein